MNAPTIGRIVHYRLGDADVESIASFRQERLKLDMATPVGNVVRAGDVFPAIIVRLFPNLPYVNLKVFLDGSDDYWATSRTEGDGECQWFWPPRG